MNLALIALAGAFGAALRYLIDFYLASRTRGAFPWGTFTVNITGSLALGLLSGLALFQGLPEMPKTIIGAGFLGAYTTFSTWMYETVRLIEEGIWQTAFWNAIGSLLAGTVAAAMGLWLASMI